MTSTWQDPPQYSGGAGGGPQIALPSLTPFTKALLWANGGLFLFFLVLREASASGVNVAYHVLGLTPELWKAWFPALPVWQLVTYGFLHSLSSPFHLLYNLLAIYFFGTLVEGIVGSRRYATFFGAALAIGAAAQLAVGWIVGTPVPVDPLREAIYTVGASGGVMAIILAAATMRPNMTVIFILFPLKMRTLAMIMVGLDLFNLLRGGTNVAVWVHLAGAAWGFAAVKRGLIWRDPLEAARSWKEERRQKGEADDRERLDRLLQQIHDEGMNSLSARDKAFLKRVSSRK